MRCTLTCAFIVMTAFVPRLVAAQTAAPARTAADITKADIDAAVKIGMAALAPGNVSVSDRNIKLSDSGAYNVAGAFVSLGGNVIGAVDGATGFAAPGDRMGTAAAELGDFDKCRKPLIAPASHRAYNSTLSATEFTGQTKTVVSFAGMRRRIAKKQDDFPGPLAKPVLFD